jgi:hypothetical protein
LNHAVKTRTASYELLHLNCFADAVTAAAEDFCKERVADPFKWSGADVPDPTKGEASYGYLMTEAGDDEALVSLTWSENSIPD